MNDELLSFMVDKCFLLSVSWLHDRVRLLSKSEQKTPWTLDIYSTCSIACFIESMVWEVTVHI